MQAMYEESINEYHFDQFSESYDMPGMMDDLEVHQEQAPEELKKESRQFAVAGTISVLAGLALFVGMNLDKIGLGGLLSTGFLEAITPFVVIGGIGALGYGLIKGWRRIFRKKSLNLPKLLIRRRFNKNERREQRRRNANPRWNQNINQVEQVLNRATYQPSDNRRLARSNNKVFLGVAAGLAENSNISVSLIRLLFIGAFAVSGGFAAVLYVLLGIFLPQRKNLKS